MRRSLLASALALTAVALPAAAAGESVAPPTSTPVPAEIVLGKSIFGVELGFTSAQVRELLGRPKSERVVSDEIQGKVRIMDYGLTKVTLSAGSSGRVQSIRTLSRSPRLSNGIGVGSARRALRASVRGVTCTSSGSFRQCAVGQFRPGRKVTTFTINAKARISAVAVGIVID